MFQLYRMYIADLRFHNPNLTIKRNASEDGPLIGQIVLVGRNASVTGEKVIECNKFKTVEELKDKITEIHN